MGYKDQTTKGWAPQQQSPNEKCSNDTWNSPKRPNTGNGLKGPNSRQWFHPWPQRNHKQAGPFLEPHKAVLKCIKL